MCEEVYRKWCRANHTSTDNVHSNNVLSILQFCSVWFGSAPPAPLARPLCVREAFLPWHVRLVWWKGQLEKYTSKYIYWGQATFYFFLLLIYSTTQKEGNHVLFFIFFIFPCRALDLWPFFCLKLICFAYKKQKRESDGVIGSLQNYSCTLFQFYFYFYSPSAGV